MPISATIEGCEHPGSLMTLYYDTAADCVTPVWVEHLGIVGDMTLNDEDEKNEVERRSLGIKEYSSGDTDISIEGEQIPDANYQGNVWINAARRGGDARQFLILNNRITAVNAAGYRGMFKNFVRNISGPRTGEQKQTFNLAPAACGTCPVRAVKVAVASTAADYDPTQVVS